MKNFETQQLIEICAMAVDSHRYISAAKNATEALRNNYEMAANYLSTVDDSRFWTALADELIFSFFDIDFDMRELCVKLLISQGRTRETRPLINYVKHFYIRWHQPLELSAMAYYHLGYTETALKAIDELESHYCIYTSSLDEENASDNLRLLLLKAHCLYELGRLDESRNLIDFINSSMPNTESLYFSAYMHRNAGDYNKAIPILREALVSEPYDSSLLFELGLNLYFSGDVEHYEIFNNLLESEEADLERPFILTYFGKNKEALKVLHSQIEQEPTSSDLQFIAAEIHSLQGNIETSIEHLQKAFRMGIRPRYFMLEDPALDNLRRSPSGIAVLTQYIERISKIDQNLASCERAMYYFNRDLHNKTFSLPINKQHESPMLEIPTMEGGIQLFKLAPSKLTTLNYEEAYFELNGCTLWDFVINPLERSSSLGSNHIQHFRSILIDLKANKCTINGGCPAKRAAKTIPFRWVCNDIVVVATFDSHGFDHEFIIGETSKVPTTIANGFHDIGIATFDIAALVGSMHRHVTFEKLKLGNQSFKNITANIDDTIEFSELGWRDLIGQHQALFIDCTNTEIKLY